MEEVDFITRQNNAFSNNYNPGWRNHPNFSWKDGGNNQTIPGFDKRPMNQPFQPKPQYQDQNSSSQQSPSYTKIEEMLNQLMNKTNEAEKKANSKAIDISGVLLKHEADLKSQQASLQNLETQIGQIARQLSDRPPGTLPSNTVTNPNATTNAVTLRSGTSTTAPTTPGPILEKLHSKETQEDLTSNVVQPKEPVQPYVPPIPYPGRLKQERLEAQYGKFLELFKQLHINIPFVEAIAQMPKYAKFLKEVLTNKRKLEELSHVTLSEECSAVLQNKLPTKMTDPGSFTIPCLIGNLSVSNALADLGASINLMPYAVFSKLGIGEPKPTRMSIQLADRSVKYPRGIVENMLVKIDKFVFLVDFVILYIEEDKSVPLIFGGPFLATAKAIIDVCTSKLTPRVNDEAINFDIGKSMQYPQQHDDTLYCVDIIDSIVSCYMRDFSIDTTS